MSETRPTVAQVVRKLETLGSADHIALFFESEHIVGVPSWAQDCPVARYVRRQTGHARIRAVPAYIETRGADGETVEKILLDRATSSLAEFMLRFDSGAYPALFQESVKEALKSHGFDQL